MLNHITIMGRLTRDPEVRYTQSNLPVASFTVAVDRDFGRGENGNRQTDFIDCTAWRQTAEFVSKYITKGSMVVVSGRLQSRQWEDRNGQKRTSWEVVAENVYFGESRRRDDSQGFQPRETTPSFDNSTYNYDNSQSSRNPFDDLSEDDGELPF